MQQTIQLFVEDQPGALMRVAGILTGKGLNIIHLLVAPEPDQPGIARMVLIVEIEPRQTKRVVTEMNRLIQVLLATDVSEPVKPLEPTQGGQLI